MIFFQQVAEHQAGSEFAWLFQPLGALGFVLGWFGVKVFVYLAGEEGDEIVLFIKSEHFRLVLGIDDGEAASGLVVGLSEPFLDEEENVTANAFASKAFGYCETANKHARIAGKHFFPTGNLPHDVAPAAGEIVDADAVVGHGEAGYDGLHVVFEPEAIGLAHEEMGVVERVLTEELVHVIISSAGKRMAGLNHLLRKQREIAV